MKERIAAPLQFKDIYYTRAEKANQPNRAFGNIIDFEGNKIGVDDISNSHPDGGTYTTIADLLKFTEAKRQHLLPSGYDYKPAAYIGGTPPWNSLIGYTNNGYSYIVMCNVGDSADKIGPRIGSILKGEKYPPLSYPFPVTLYKMLIEKGIDYVEQNINDLCRQDNKRYDDRFLDFYGYAFLNGGKSDIAIELFTLNTKLFPNIPQTFDSLAAAYLKSGDKANARKNYNKVLELDPRNERVKDALRNLGN